MATTFRGVYAAMVTPMTAEEELDCATLTTLVDHLIEQGVHGLIPLGSTGEYYALSDAERREIVETVIRAADGRLPVLVGTNAAGTRQVVEHSRRAEQAGAVGLLLAAPYYSLPTADELFDHFRVVSEAVNIPIMLYNYPARTGVDLVPSLIARLSELENVQYVKESSGDLLRVSEIIDLCGERITVFCGCDTGALASFVSGAVGWVGGGPNFLPAAHVKLFELAVEENDFEAARELASRLLPALRVLEGGKYTQLVKNGCELMGYPVGPPRRPLLPVTAEESAALKEAIDRLGEV
ncbi:MAG: 4-hydroxy-tetrahydrodipicolinate synthase [Thermoguttaceae bacterium]